MAHRPCRKLTVIAVLLGIATPAVGQDDPSGELTVSLAIRESEFGSLKELNGYLDKTLTLTYKSEELRATNIILVSVLALPDGKRVSTCTSDRFLTEPGKTGGGSMPEPCGKGQYIQVNGDAGRVLPGEIHLGEVTVVRVGGRGTTQPLDVVGKVAADQARRLKMAVLAIGAFPADPKEVMQLGLVAAGTCTQSDETPTPCPAVGGDDPPPPPPPPDPGGEDEPPPPPPSD